MNRLGYLNINKKFILFLSILLLSVCGTLSSIFAIYTIEIFKDDLQKIGLTEASNLAIETKFGTLTEDAEILIPILGKKLINPDILFIEVVNKDNKILVSNYRYQPILDQVSTSKPPLIQLKKSSISNIISSLYNINDIPTKINLYKITTPIYSTPIEFKALNYAIDEITESELISSSSSSLPTKKILGEVRVGLSLDRLEKKTFDVLLFIFIVTLVVLLFSILICYVFVRRALTPLLGMSNIATQIANSNLQNVSFSHDTMTLNNPYESKNHTLSATSFDEIGLLTEAFIKMSSRLKEYELNLELQVKKRTEELSQALDKSKQLKTAAEATNAQLELANHQLQLFRLCIEKTSDFILITDQYGQSHTSNQSFLEQNGYTSDEVKFIRLRSFFAVSEFELFDSIIWPTITDLGEWKGETRFLKNSGTIYPIDLSITSVNDDRNEVIAYICIFRDITQQQQHKHDLIELASRDPLTGLFNRRRFLEELEKEIIRCKRHHKELALLWLDLDHFKEINDSLGHPAGDELLKILTQNLKDLTRDTDIIARLGGDEFAILLCDTSLKSTKISAERLINGIRSNLITIDNKPIRMMISVGIAMFPNHGTTSHALFTNADIALYKSKHAGRNQLNFFHPDDLKHQQYSQHDAWVQRIWDALEENRLMLYLQPIVDIIDGKISHFELLLRMYDENGNIIMPGSFIPIAERTGLIHEIDLWVIKNAVKQYACSDLQEKNLKVTINLSAKALGDEKFPDFIKSVFEKNAVDPKMFIIEITENSAISDFKKATQFISRLKQIGFKFALDDFGVGFASFSHLKNLDVDYLKIDGSFVKEIIDQPKDRGIVEAIIKAAQSLNIKTIAEWVETQETITLLNNLGIDYVQGYFLGKPEPFSSPKKQKKIAPISKS